MSKHLSLGRFCSKWNFVPRNKHVSQFQKHLWRPLPQTKNIHDSSGFSFSWHFRKGIDTVPVVFKSIKHVQPGEPRFWKTWAKASASALPSFPAACARRDGQGRSHLETVEFLKWQRSHKKWPTQYEWWKHKPMEAWLGLNMSQSPANLTIRQVLAFGSTKSTHAMMIYSDS